MAAELVDHEILSAADLAGDPEVNLAARRFGGGPFEFHAAQVKAIVRRLVEVQLDLVRLNLGDLQFAIDAAAQREWGEENEGDAEGDGGSHAMAPSSG